MKNVLFGLLVMATSMSFGQVSLNDYEYVIVPKKFDGFKTENQYLTSTYVKYLFTEKGFKTVYDDELPQELNANRCLGLLIGLKDDSNMFTTKTTLLLKDCSSREVFASKQGTSKIKEFKAAYKEAIEAAFSSFNEVDYAYNGALTKDNSPLTVSFKDDVKQLGAPKETVSVPTPNPLVVQRATPDEQLYKSNEPVPSQFKKAEVQFQVTPKGAPADATAVWYAQVMPYGYQLVDSSPKVQMQLYKSSVPDVFMAKKEDKSGVVFRKDNKWFFEYYAGASPVIEEISIKF
ncbi:hypothetical protein U1E44_07360 [Arenibacter sp. GZD96]|uniref:hypothetical protein n=1 Tax=Aurantibrevibacter litoralis TaxID=3106030 RepID=UPI002AFFB939|nr:hypothetical protein [Arenibacter sp. GZD-96]MEA1785904.1 hypothetical protein [Arenibacter sp. GZD-96]